MPSDIPPTSGIYKIICIPTGKFYVGSASNLRRRWQKHHNELQHGTHHNSKLQRAWTKYTEQSFIFEIIELVPATSLIAREQYWLNELNPFDQRGFNLAVVAGSSFAGLKHSSVTREKMRLAQLGHTHTVETREKLSKSKRGKPGTNLGKKFSPETCARISASKRGKPGKALSPEARRKISLANSKRTHSLEAREKIGAAHRGKPSPNLGKRLGPEVRAKISAARMGRKPRADAHAHRRKTLILTAPDGTEHLVHGVRTFCEEHGLSISSIMQVAKGKQKQHRGWMARFPEPDMR